MEPNEIQKIFMENMQDITSSIFEENRPHKFPIIYEYDFGKFEVYEDITYYYPNKPIEYITLNLKITPAGIEINER